jgi:flagellar motor switch protein FliM
MAQREQIDQDALAAEWGVALEAEQEAAAETAAAPAESESGPEAMAAHWAAMVDDGHFTQTTKGGAERVLTQDEIDSLLGFSLDDISLNDNSGIRAIIDSAMV